MPASNDHPFLRPARLNSYLAYSIGCAIAWAIVWLIAGLVAPQQTLDRIGYVFGGWVIGWVSASLARIAYPPPKKRDWAGPRSFFQGLRGS
jgi:hypothetical protein